MEKKGNMPLPFRNLLLLLLLLDGHRAAPGHACMHAILAMLDSIQNRWPNTPRIDMCKATDAQNSWLTPFSYTAPPLCTQPRARQPAPARGGSGGPPTASAPRTPAQPATSSYLCKDLVQLRLSDIPVKVAHVEGGVGQGRGRCRSGSGRRSSGSLAGGGGGGGGGSGSSHSGVGCCFRVRALYFFGWGSAKQHPFSNL